MRNLKAARKMKGLSQQEIADLMQIDRSTYTRYETGSIQPDNTKLIQLSTILEVSIDFLLDRPNNPDNSNDRRLIPVLGEVPAGHPIEAFEQVEEYLDLYPSFAQYGELFGLRVKGQSMEPDIHNGDIVIVVKQDFIDSGDVAVVRVNGTEVTVKKVKKMQDGIMLMPKNPAFEPVYFSNEQVRTLPVTIIGKVLEIRRRL